jgi:acetyl esterase
MPLDPVIDDLVQALREAPPPAVPQDRAIAEQSADSVFADLGQPGPEVAEVRDCQVATDLGPIRVRLYFPAEGGLGPLPAYVFLFGGAFWHGSVEMAGNDAACRERCVRARCLVAAVDYRLVPEHPFPRAVEDVYEALVWLIEHAGALGVDPSRLAIGGASAGGNLAAALALMARDRGGPAVSLQILEVPVLDLTFSQPSVEEQCAFLGLESASLRQIASLYLADVADAHSPYASPLLADDLAGLPPALILVSEHDPLRDDGEAYAQRLSQAGVTAVCVRYGGQIHSSPGMTAVVPAARVWREQVIAALARLHGEAPWL